MVANYKLKSPENKKVSSDVVLIPVSEAKVMVKGSVKKINRDLMLVRGIRLRDAMNYLYYSPYASSEPLAKLLKSAAANALNTGLVSESGIGDLVVSRIWANKFLSLKRMRAASRGRPSPRRKHYCMVFIELSLVQA